MNRYKIKWTPFALWCLEEIHSYLLKESKSKKIADSYIQKLLKRVDQLETFPESGNEEELLKAIGQNSRYLLEGNYKLIYQVEKSEIIITDVFHVKQNPKKIVKRNKKK